jgi:hypothetical protein
MVGRLHELGYSVKLACEVLGLSRSSYYYRGQEPDPGLEADLKEVLGTHPTYGTRRAVSNGDKSTQIIGIKSPQNIT